MEITKSKLIFIIIAAFLAVAVGSFLFDKKEISTNASLFEGFKKTVAMEKEIGVEGENYSAIDESEGGVIKDPWLNGYSYRKPITITNSTSTLNNYQARVNVDTSTLVSNSKMQSDCDDIRMTTADGYTLMDYWIEAGCNTATTTIWTEIPSIANGNSTIYMYYGNTSSTVASNGNNTFDSFADFTTSLPDGWTTPGVDTYRGYTFENGNLVLYGGVRGKSTGWWYGNSSVYNTDVELNGKIIETRLRAYQAGTYRTYQYAYVVGLSGGGWVAGRYKLANNWLQLVESTTLRWDSATTWNGALTGYYILGLAYDGSYRKIFEDYSEKCSYSAGVNQANGKGGVTGTMADTTGDGKYEGYFDWYRMRKYTANEPTASIGSEVQLITQAGTSTAEWTWKAPVAGDKIKNGTSTNWSWTNWADDGTGVIVPASSSTDWTWYPQ